MLTVIDSLYRLVNLVVFWYRANKCSRLIAAVFKDLVTGRLSAAPGLILLLKFDQDEVLRTQTLPVQLLLVHLYLRRLGRDQSIADLEVEVAFVVYKVMAQGTTSVVGTNSTKVSLSMLECLRDRTNSKKILNMLLML